MHTCWEGPSQCGLLDCTLLWLKPLSRTQNCSTGQMDL